MKKLTLRSVAALLVATLMLFSSCSKEGPEGPQGPQGAQGPQGTQGPEGDPGTANVIYSDWLDVGYAADTVHDGATIDTIGFYTAIEAPDLDNAILTNGEIKVYVNLGTADEPVIAPLPYFSIFDGVSIEPIYYLNTVDLYSNIDASTVLDNNNNKRRQYRYILIPGGTAASARKSGVSIDWNDYNAVKKYLNLKD
ncbi:MAG: collagen-like triple helix repeat-containing protein [Agriterribacter sp.]